MNRNSAGFTMLEIMVSVVILTVALLALSSLQTVSVGSNYTSNRLTVATTLAQQKLEELKGLPWSDMQLADTQDNFTLDSDGDGLADDFDWSQPVDHTNADAPGAVANPIDETGTPIAGAALPTQGYSRIWNVAHDVPTSKMKTVSVRVTWRDKILHSVTLDTVLSEE